jgi:hypothetical protein
VLIEAVRHFDAARDPGAFIPPLAAVTVAEHLGREVEDVMAAVRALARGGYVEEMRASMSSKAGSRIKQVSAEAYRAVGAWPSPDTAADRLLAALQAAVDNAPEGEAKNRARRILDGFRAAGRDFLVDVASGVVTGQISGS